MNHFTSLTVLIEHNTSPPAGRMSLSNAFTR